MSKVHKVGLPVETLHFTCGPQIGSRPLHLVLAFWSAALSHSSRRWASLVKKNYYSSLNN